MSFDLHFAFVNYTVIARMAAACLKDQTVTLYTNPFRKVPKNLV